MSEQTKSYAVTFHFGEDEKVTYDIEAPSETAILSVIKGAAGGMIDVPPYGLNVLEIVNLALVKYVRVLEN